MIRLPDDAASALLKLAVDEHRDVKRQAETLILEGLRKRRYLDVSFGRAANKHINAEVLRVGIAEGQRVGARRRGDA